VPGMEAARQLSMVVLPDWVLPHRRMLTGDDRRAEEGGCLRIQGSQDHKIVEGVSASDEFLDGSKGAQCQVTAVRRRLTHRAW